MPNYEVHYLSVSDADAIIIRYENSGDQYVTLEMSAIQTKSKTIFGITGKLILLI